MDLKTMHGEMNEPLSEEEQNILDQAHNIFGDNWTEISRRLPGRNDSYVKNHLNAIKQVEDAKKKSMKMVKIENQPNYIFEGLTTLEDELGGYVPMTFNDDYELYGLEFYPEAPMKKEINFMKMLCGNL
ncbi:transcription factor MYB118 [Medicago truncatula]|uniref:transcription factor MYB118 n=1 Tax=Medicago truncatula TaxID=3880 RepID=UPI000D2F1EA7|nr:transcription factor MYB118 [Medicago truncatula]